MNKKEVQQRVLKNGKPLALDLFEWDEKTNTFSSLESFLVIDFLGIFNCTFTTSSDCTFTTSFNCTFTTGSDCTFKTGFNCTFTTGFNCTFKTSSDCTFKTGFNCTFTTGFNCTFTTGSGCTFTTSSDCTFKTGVNCTFTTGSGCTFKTGFNCTFMTGSGCTFKTSSDCTFKTGSGCTFMTGSGCTFKTGFNCTFMTGSGCTFTTGSGCVIVRRDVFEVIQQKTDIKICPYEIPGYLELINGKWYLNGDKSLGEHIIADNILSKVISKKGNVYRVINYDQTEKSYLVTDGENWSHGKTLKEARDSLRYKISNRDTSKYKGMKLTTNYTKEEAIKMYRVITGACEGGVRGFLETIKTKKEKYSVKEIIELTKGQWGNEALINFVTETN